MQYLCLAEHLEEVGKVEGKLFCTGFLKTTRDFCGSSRGVRQVCTEEKFTLRAGLILQPAECSVPAIPGCAHRWTSPPAAGTNLWLVVAPASLSPCLAFAVGPGTKSSGFCIPPLQLSFPSSASRLQHNEQTNSTVWISDQTQHCPRGN